MLNHSAYLERQAPTTQANVTTAPATTISAQPGITTALPAMTTPQPATTLSSSSLASPAPVTPPMTPPGFMTSSVAPVGPAPLPTTVSAAVLPVTSPAATLPPIKFPDSG